MSRFANLKRYRVFIIAGVLLVCTLAAGVMAVVHWLSSPPPQVKKTVQEISLVRPPPPPEQEPPPPPPEEEEVDVPEPEETPEPTPMDEPPPGDLGLDAEGVGGADGFGLVGRPGGRSIVGAGSNRFRWYANSIKQTLVAYLAEYEQIRSRRYSVKVSLWLNEDGSVRDVTLAGTTGDADLDRQLTAALEGLDTVGNTPPRDLPQPVQLRIVSRL